VRSRDEVLWVALGLIGYAMLKQSREGIAWGAGWHKPVPDLIIGGVTYPAVISQEWRSSGHRGIDVMFKRRNLADRVDYPNGKVDPGGAKASAWHFAPERTPILAARDGKVWSVQNVPGYGIWVVLDHGAPWATSYHHLASANVVKGQDVKAGQAIGTMGHAELDGEKLRHLHFEPWFKGGDSTASVDPAGVFGTWGVSTWTL
jgi:hypothetical protein